MNSSWIPVTENYPDENISVQVTYVGYNDGVRYCDGFAYWDGEKWFWSLDDSTCEVRIVAWKNCCSPYVD